jgi:hypothetical protein
VCDEGTKDLDGSLLTGKGGCEYKCPVFPAKTDDPIDDKFLDENCDGSDGVVEGCVFVSTSIGSDDDAAADGTRFKPYASIAKAIQVAATNKIPGVCVSGEIYNEQVTMVSGVSLYGGFDHKDSEFIFRRKADVTTTIRAKGTVILAPKIDADTHIEGLTLIADAPDESEEDGSVYGIRLGGGSAKLWIRSNNITVAAGRKGKDGENASPPASLTATGGVDGTDGKEKDDNSGKGGPAPVCEIPGGKGGDGGKDTSAGTDGSDSPDGTPGGKGASANGCTPALGDPGKKGDDGQPGADGGQGEPGQGGLKLGTADQEKFLYTPAHGGDGKVGKNGKGGGGGGGGGGGSGAGLCFGAWDKGGGGGSGGCGGLGGAFGRGGRGGGGSFGVFVSSGKAEVDRNKIKTGNGGDGGKGGDGNIGQSGGPPSNGGKHSDDSGPGGKGGKGGKGGTGGPGGGGGGGPSACVGFDFNKANVNISTDGSCSTGAPGLGGQGGTNPEGAKANAGENGQTGEKVGFNN